MSKRSLVATFLTGLLDVQATFCYPLPRLSPSTSNSLTHSSPASSNRPHHPTLLSATVILNAQIVDPLEEDEGETDEGGQAGENIRSRETYNDWEASLEGREVEMRPKKG
ncbi:hypothetical protein VNI00_016743 [Paramarasmius palmivorus]|uniref:Uncharacterized protein n=1 Tax=Paramarasmius palmivorus TaxID=297713 RepID=A0AAW0BET5_9AGAR